VSNPKLVFFGFLILILAYVDLSFDNFFQMQTRLILMFLVVD